MPTAYCRNIKCSHFRKKPVSFIGGGSFPGHCNVWVHELDEDGVCLDYFLNKSVEVDRAGLCNHSGIPGTPCDKDNCNSGCLS